MKKLPLTAFMLLTTSLLAACDGGGGGSTTPTTYDLTVNLSGPNSAPIKVTNTTTNTVLFNGTLDTTKTFKGIAANSVLTVEGEAVNGYTAPAAQTLTLDSSKTTTVTYTPVSTGNLRTLTLNVSGTTASPVTITNTTTQTVVFDGTITGSTTLKNIPENSVLAITPKAVDGLTTPPAQTVTVSGDTTTTLRYLPQNAVTHTLTVTVTGVPSAPLKITDAVTGDVLFQGSLSGNSSFPGLLDGSQAVIQPGEVADHQAPATQTVTLDSSKTVVLTYTPRTDKVLNETAISGVIQGNTLKLDKVYLATPSNPWFLTSKVDASNAINVPLNGVPAASDLTTSYAVGVGSTCQGTNTDAQARVFYRSYLNAYGAQGDLLGRVREVAVSGTGTTADRSHVARIYSDRPFTFTGTCTYTNADGTTSIEDNAITLKAGWNAVLVTTDGTNFTVRNVASDVRTTLKFTAATPRVSVSITPNTLSFTTNDTSTVDAVFAQVGGYSGTVTLSTDVPGLTVEPATVTLNALQAQNLKAQALTQKLTFRYSGNQIAAQLPFNLIVSNTSGAELTRTAGSMTVSRPGIQINVQQNTWEYPRIAQGETGQVQVTVSSLNNFAGTATVSLTDLPAGVTATPTNVTITAGEWNKTVTIPVTASTSVATGTITGTVTVTSATPYSVAGGPVSMIVEPQRINLGSPAVTGMSLAGAQMWIAKQSSVVMLQGNQVAYSTSVTGDPAGLTVVGADGSMWVRSTAGGTLSKFSNGSLKSFSIGGMNGGAQSFAVDAQGRAWFTVFDGFNVPTLKVLNPVTGEASVVPTVKSANTSVSVQHDGTGRYVFFPASDGTLVRVDTTTLESTASTQALALAPMESVQTMTLDRDKNLWVVTTGPRAFLYRIDPVTLSVLQQVDVSGMDIRKVAIEDANTAWFLTDGSVKKMNLADRTTTDTTYTGYAQAIALAPTRGIAYAFGTEPTGPMGGTSYVRYLGQ